MMDLWNERAEQAILGGLLKDNDAIDRIPFLQPEHFYVGDNQVIFAEICRQTSGGRRVDAITLMEALHDRVPDGMTYLMQLHVNSAGAATIQHHAEIVIERAQRRFLDMVGTDLKEGAKNAAENPQSLCDVYAAKLDEIVQRKGGKEPALMSDRMVDYLKLIERRMEGLVRPIRTGYRDLDRRLGGGLERGTLTIAAGRPGTGKSAFGLGVARNVAKDGVALFLSLEMSEELVHDRNVSAIAEIPISWLRSPTQQDQGAWDRLTPAMEKVQKMRLFIDDETSLSPMAIRTKARQIKRKYGLDLLVIDQLSFIQAAKKFEHVSYAIGEITRALVALSKELDCAVLLLAQLNRECEKRPDKRPIMADLALSSSLEQDAANILFLYRDELYNETTIDQGIAEINVAKQRQGALGVVALAYEAIYTRFSDLSRPWSPNQDRRQQERRGLAAGLGG